MEWRTRMDELLRENERLVTEVERFRVDNDEPHVEGVLQQLEHHIAALNAFYAEIGSSLCHTSHVLLTSSFDLRP
ncbi:MAG TPA: hypothetical protein VF456_18950 [Vicinamibacterales bacterium]